MKFLYCQLRSIYEVDNSLILPIFEQSKVSLNIK